MCVKVNVPRTGCIRHIKTTAKTFHCGKGGHWTVPPFVSVGLSHSIPQKGWRWVGIRAGGLGSGFRVQGSGFRGWRTCSKKIKRPAAIIAGRPLSLLKWRRRPDSNRWIKVLQTFALPLGHAATKKNGAGNGI